ncbi:MAG: hypothetical protein RI952_508 [Bacteroidota bacterium]|jgi:hypothetical protein
MKRKLLLLLSLAVAGFSASAQQAFHTQNSGFTTASRGINDFDVVDSNIVWAVAYDGSGAAATIRDFTVTTDGGYSWLAGAVKGTTASALNNYGLANISAIDGSTAYASIYPVTTAVGLQGVYKTVNSGATWTKVSTGAFTNASSFINVVHFFDAQNGIAAGDPANGYFEIYTTSNGGVNWTRVPSANIPCTPLATEYGTVGYYAAHDSTFVYPTTFGRILLSKDMGATWALGTTPLDSTDGTALPSISFQDQDFAVAVMANTTAAVNTFIISLDGGLTWDYAGIDTVGGVYDFNAIEFVNGTNGTWFATSANSTTGGMGAAYTEDGAQTWISIDKEQHTCVRFNDINNGWAGGFNTSATVGGVSKWGSVRTAAGLSNNKVDGFEVYPNPSNGKFYVKANVKGASAIKVMDLTGRVVFQENYPTKALLFTTVDLSNQSSGIYFVEVREGNNVSIQKVSVQ